MKRIVQRKFLKIIVIISFFIVLCINHNFIIQSNAYTKDEEAEAYEFLDKIQDISSVGDSKNVERLNKLGISEVKSIYKKLSDDKFFKMIDEIGARGGNRAAANAKQIIGFYVSEVDRVKYYSDKYNAIKSYDSDEYNEKSLDSLESMKKSISKNNSDEYSDNYFQNVIDNLGGILGQDYKIDNKLTVDNNPKEVLKKEIDSKINSIKSHAKDIAQPTGNISATTDPDYYDPSSSGISADSSDGKIILSKAGVVLGAIRNISVAVSVISLMIIGVKYIFASVEEKAKYKETLLPYVIGILMVAAGSTIVTTIYNAIK